MALEGQLRVRDQRDLLGFVPGYFQGPDGGTGEDGCVCSVGPVANTGSEQVIGATCYSNATTDAGPGLGSC